MRINSLTIRNFKGFALREFSFNPQFNLLVGANGTGKTTILDALAVALGPWTHVVPGADERDIEASEARYTVEVAKTGTLKFDLHYPTQIEADGIVFDREAKWIQTTRDSEDITAVSSKAGPKSVYFKRLKNDVQQKIANKRKVILPVIAYYGCDRLWRDNAPVKRRRSAHEKSRFSAYADCFHTLASASELTTWVRDQDWRSFQERKESLGSSLLKGAIVSAIEGAEQMKFDPEREEIVLLIRNEWHAFSSLSAGQRTLLTLIGDIARRCIVLNPDEGSGALTLTNGVVLIDELDLHLHPIWQERVVQDLRRIFPLMQFVATTHSPFIVQTARENELISLDSQPLVQTSMLGIEAIARGIMNVPHPEIGSEYWDLKKVAKDYLTTINESDAVPESQLAAFVERLAASIGPYAHNPAFQAFLELQRDSKLGARMEKLVRKSKPPSLPL
jgi:predicted ATP-binding protein involved in virulence